MTKRVDTKRSQTRGNFTCLNIFPHVIGYSILLIALIALIFIALSDNCQAGSPHGPFSSATDKCSSCHRMHTSINSKLLPQLSNEALCESCHSKGQGADTAVMEGIYINSQNPDQSWGEDTVVLLGGGFEKIGDSNTVTSKHLLEVAGTPYGSSPSKQYTLTCISCHTPHQSPNYRLLRRRPGESSADVNVTWNGPWTDSTESEPGGEYRGFTEIDFTATSGYKEYTRNYQSGFSSWCQACHTKYLERGPEKYNPGDIYEDVIRYRHGIDVPIADRTNPVNEIQYDLETELPLEDITGNGRSSDDELTCVTCHRSHGTDVSMTGEAVLSSAERGILPSGTDSMLLRQSDRLMCSDCHDI